MCFARPFRPLTLVVFFYYYLSTLFVDSAVKKAKRNVVSPQQVEYEKQIVRIQALIRGVLARWNLPVLKLTRKLDAIRNLKDKQLKKLAQRTEQHKKSIRIEMEHHFEHRVLLRRAQKAEFLQTHFRKLMEKEQLERRTLARESMMVNQQTTQLRSSMFQTMRDTGALRMEIAQLGKTQSELQRQSQVYENAISLLQQAIAAVHIEGESC